MSFELALSECWVTQDSTIPYFKGYSSTHVPFVSGKAGGLVIFYKSGLIVKRLNFENIFPDSQLEVLAVDIKNLFTKLILCYRHPKGKINAFLNHLENLLESKILNNNLNDIVICGDFNINTLESSPTADSYLSLLKSFGYRNLVTEATRETASSQTCIDHAFAKL